MPETRLPSPVRATMFYTVSLMLLITLGAALQRQYGLTGVVLMQLTLFLGLAAGFALTLDRRPLRQVFRLRLLTVRGFGKSALLGLLAWGLAQVLGFLMLAIVERLGGHMPAQYQELMTAPYPMALLVGALLPAICEETAFRGFILSNLRPLGRIAAVAMTGLLFGLMHLSLVRAIPLTVLGLIFAAAVDRSGSVLPGMVMHFVNNATALTLTYLVRGVPVAEPGAELAAASGPFSTGLLLLSGAALFLGAVAWALLRTFGPWDVAGPLAPILPASSGREMAADLSQGAAAAPAGSTALRREESALLGWLLALGPLLPAAVIYLWAASGELSVVFALGR